MLYLIFVLRLLHIVSGIFWVGAALMLTFFISPAVQATQESGQKFFSHVIQNTSLNKIILIAALTTLLAGLTLYGIDSNGFRSSWMLSGPGLGFGLGGFLASIGFHFGFLQGRRSTALIKLGQEVKGQGTPPTELQLKSMQTLQAQLKTGGKLNAIFLLLASIMMATARFWLF